MLARCLTLTINPPILMAHLTEEQQGALTKALATTLGMTVADVEKLAIEKPADLDTGVSERLKAVRKEGKEGGMGELQSKLNSKIKEVFGVDVKDISTVAAAVDAVKENYKPVVDPTTLTEEQVKAHPAFKAQEQALATRNAEFETELTKARQEGELKVSKLQLDKLAEKALVDYGAVLSDDESIRNAQLHLYKQKLEGVSRKEVDGKVEFWKDGKRIETDKLLPVSEADFFKGLVQSSFTTKVSEQMGSPNPAGSPKPGGGGQQNGDMKHYKGQLPKTQAEFDKIVNEPLQSFEVIAEVGAYWASQNK